MIGVAIGGSAGALEALHDLLAPIPATVNAVFLVVVHISPSNESLLAQVLANYTSMRVREAVDKLPLATRTVVVAPPDYHMLVETDLTIALSRDRPEHFSRPALDPLFDTFAIAFARRGYGILLSGGNADGAAGLAAIHAAGGKTAVQEPGASTSPEMPRAGLALITPTFRGNATAIGRWLATELAGGAR